MAANDFTEFSSVFDEMMARTRQRFQEQSAGTFRQSSPSPPSATLPATDSAAENHESEARRQLNERFGEGWSYEIIESRREGEEMIVMCKVDIPDREISKTQFGSARIPTPGARTTLQGTTDGIPIAVDIGEGIPLNGEPEQFAFSRAVEAALAKCAELL